MDPSTKVRQWRGNQSMQQSATRIRELRKEQGMSQMCLTAIVGVSYQQIQKYEGKASGSFSVERLEQISKAFKFPVKEFFPAKKALGIIEMMSSKICHLWHSCERLIQVGV